jgi:hypothetical protein
VVEDAGGQPPDNVTLPDIEELSVGALPPGIIFSAGDQVIGIIRRTDQSYRHLAGNRLSFPGDKLGGRTVPS